MTEIEKKYLFDILQSISRIEEFTLEIKSFPAYSSDFKTKSAVERQLAIIGEAVNKYCKISDQNKFENATQIISMRNRIIHSYDSLDDNLIWSIIKRHLNPLKQETEKKLSTLF
jgi:uncharacterized protein with HEPN domain